MTIRDIDEGTDLRSREESRTKDKLISSINAHYQDCVNLDPSHLLDEHGRFFINILIFNDDMMYGPGIGDIYLFVLKQNGNVRTGKDG
jgi:hypothetical protein